ncbi:helix-hairpin-helix domain-containing protein [Rhizobium sp. BK376]|uniref:helix-hairpin-helix domain-containing protein n=1 Tax=Rhizobium/Agrobacterium group TaxID=227290 RepID=UPI0032AFB9E6
MTKSADAGEGRDAADASAEFGRLAAEMLQNSHLHPLMTNPAAAMAAVTAIGFGFSTQMAGAFWGAVQGAVEATNKFAAALEEQKSASPVQRQTESNVAVNAAPAAKAAPVVKVRAKAKPAVDKPAPVKAKADATVEAAAPKVVKAPARGRKTTAKADDLKLISGVGPKLEMVLRERGIGTFADIASWSDADVAHIDADLGFEGRIARDDWVGQAKALLAPKAAGGK